MTLPLANGPILPGVDIETSLSSQLAEIAYNVKTGYGAKGDGVTDDTQAIQNALNDANTKGGIVFLPAGTYKVTSPLTINWSYNVSKITGIYGVGSQSIIAGTISTSGRGVLELLGTDNGSAVNMFIKDFRIQMVGGNSGAFCLRVGDSRNFRGERITCEGANALDLKVASSSSYAEINCVFDQCRFLTNRRNETVVTDWFANDNLATLYALQVETGGASWDNVHFRSCEFVGECAARAWICEFENCQFSTNPNRPGGYNENVHISMGSASFDNCYFEDHTNAIVLANSLSHLYNVSIRDCHFSGQTNYGVDGINGIQIVDLGNGNHIGSVTIQDCAFGTYSNAGIDASSATSAIVKVDGLSFLYDPSQPVPIKGRIQGFKCEWIKFAGTITTDNAVSYAVLSTSGLVNPSYYYVDFPAWISRVKLVVDAKTSAGNLTVGLFKNGASILSENVDTSTIFTNRQAETTYEEATAYNPWLQTRYLNTGDKLNVHMNSDAAYAPLNTKYELWVELVY